MARQRGGAQRLAHLLPARGRARVPGLSHAVGGGAAGRCLRRERARALAPVPRGEYGAPLPAGGHGDDPPHRGVPAGREAAGGHLRHPAGSRLRRTRDGARSVPSERVSGGDGDVRGRGPEPGRGPHLPRRDERLQRGLARVRTRGRRGPADRDQRRDRRGRAPRSHGALLQVGDPRPRGAPHPEAERAGHPRDGGGERDRPRAARTSPTTGSRCRPICPRAR